MGLFLGLPAEVSQVRTQWAAGESGRAVTSALPLLELWCARLPSTAPNFTPDQFPPIRLIPHSLPRPATIVNVCASPWDVVDSHSFLNHTPAHRHSSLSPSRARDLPPPRARPHRPSTYPLDYYTTTFSQRHEPDSTPPRPPPPSALDEEPGALLSAHSTAVLLGFPS